MTETFKILSDYAHARLRAEMYLSSREEHTQTVLHFDGTNLTQREFTWVPALFTAFREIVDNSLDEILGHGHGDTLTVDYDPETMIVTVRDNGRGIPIDEKPELGKGPAASILLGEAKAGRNFDERGTVAGVNGLGASVVNFTSEFFELTIHRDKQKFFQRWDEGVYGGKEIHRTKGPILEPDRSPGTYTEIRFRPSEKVFRKMTLPFHFVLGRMWDIAVANPKLKVIFNGEHLKPKSGRDPVVATYFENQTVGLIDITSGTFRGRYYVSPSVFPESDETIHSTVNNIPTLQGGSHIDAFRDLFYSKVIEILSKDVKKEKLVIKRTDVSEGLLIFNITSMNDAHFDSQSKSRLITEVKTVIKDGFLESDVKQFIKRNPIWVAEVLDRCRRRTNAKVMKEIDNEQKKKTKAKVANLCDATGNLRHECILFIAEGESAISGMTAVRDHKIHGGIGLRGKILNVWDETAITVVNNKVLSDIMASLGLKIGQKASPQTMRYGRIYIATDEDEDGKNITALLVAFFYKYWPELFQNKKNPVVFKFATPFIIAVKGKDRKYFYSHDYEAFEADLIAGKYSGWKIIRAKGLARLTKLDWEYSVENPMLIPILDNENLKPVLDLIFNDARADDRKRWLS